MTPIWAALALVRRWQRNALAAATIILGSAAVVILSSLATASAMETAKSFRDDDSDTLRVSFRAPADWSVADDSLDQVLRRAGAAAAGTFTELQGEPAEIRSASQVGESKMIIATREGLTVFGSKILAGTPWPDEAIVARDPERVLVGARLARDLGIRVGDEIFLAGRTCHVDGLVTDTGHRSLVTTSVMIHPKTAEAWGITKTAKRDLFVRVPEGQATGVKEAAARALTIEDPGAAEVVANVGPTQLRDRLVSEAKGLVLVVTLSVASVSVLTVFTTLFAATRERRSEIGILYALGSTPRSVATSLAVEAAILGFASSFAGFCCGTVGAAAICALLGWTPTFEPWLLLIPPGGLLTSLVGAILPAVLAAKVDPNELIRS